MRRVSKIVVVVALLTTGTGVTSPHPAAADWLRCVADVGQYVTDHLETDQRGGIESCTQPDCWEDYHEVYVSSASGNAWADAQDDCDDQMIGEGKVSITAQGPATGEAAGHKVDKSDAIYVKTGVMVPVNYSGTMCYDSGSEFNRPGAFPGIDGTFKEKCTG